MKEILVLLLASAAYAAELHKPAFLEDIRAVSGSRILIGQPAVNGQFPWQALLLTTTASGGSIVCGGSLISSTWVMTAAHCVQGVSSEVYLGNVTYAQSPVILSTTNLVPHPNFNSSNLNNDIALVGLNSAVSETANIRAVPLATDLSQTFANSTATVSGFGMTFNPGSISPTLHYAGVRVITNADCAGWYGSSRIIASSICAVGELSPAQGICYGDEGGPLVLDINGVTTQIGIASYIHGSGCSFYAPNVFVRPAHFASWISSITGM